MSAPKSQSMKAETAAKKLDILLSATPPEFQNGPVTRDELNELQQNPPEWLAELRRNGPHPRQEVARKLGVSASGLARAEITEPLTTAQIKELLATMPAWLVTERARQATVHEENARIKAQDAAKRKASQR